VGPLEKKEMKRKKKKIASRTQQSETTSVVDRKCVDWLKGKETLYQSFLSVS
jgi:hypothetical protein